MAYIQTKKEQQKIPDVELSTLDDVQTLLAIGGEGYSFTEWKSPNEDEPLVYTKEDGGRRCYQLVGPNGELQSVGQLIDKIQGSGYFDKTNPGNWIRVNLSRVEPTPESVDQSADVAAAINKAAALGFTQADRDTLERIARKVGA